MKGKWGQALRCGAYVKNVVAAAGERGGRVRGERGMARNRKGQTDQWACKGAAPNENLSNVAAHLPIDDPAPRGWMHAKAGEKARTLLCY